MRRIDFSMFRMFCIFVMSNIYRGGEACLLWDRYFFTCQLHMGWFRTPVWSVNAPNSASVLLDSGTGGIIFLVSNFTKVYQVRSLSGRILKF